MNVYMKVTLRSSSEGYLYTFGVPLGLTGTGAHLLTPKTLEKMSLSIDNIKVVEQEKVMLQFTMANPMLYGIRPVAGDPSVTNPTVTVRVDIAAHSGIPSYQLYGKTWVVVDIRMLSSTIVDSIDL